MNIEIKKIYKTLQKFDGSHADQWDRIYLGDEYYINGEQVSKAMIMRALKDEINSNYEFFEIRGNNNNR